MIIEQLVPGVQNRDKAQFAAEPVFRVCAELDQGLRHHWSDVNAGIMEQSVPG